MSATQPQWYWWEKNVRRTTTFLLLHQPCWPLTLINVFVFWRVEGITALIELPKNYIAAAMDKKISKSTKYGADEQISRLKVRYLKQNIPLSLQWSTAWQFLLIPLCQWLRSAASPTTRIRSELLSTSMVSLKLGVSVWFLSCKETAFWTHRPCKRWM